MSHGHTRSRGPWGPRGSLSYMPPIDENQAVSSTPQTLTPVYSPRMPLRIPAKSPRRALRAYGHPPPYISSVGSPPGYKEAAGVEILEKRALKGEGYGEMTCCGLRRRGRCCVVIVAVVVMIVLAIGLGIGLSLGLKEKTKPSLRPPNLPSSDFPSGSYAFKASLQPPSTDCTASSSTWRCHPYTPGSSTTFFWIIANVNTQFYTISSSANPFAPFFSNQTISLTDEGKDTERLSFSFTMDKLVVPDGDVAGNNRATRCTYRGTRLEATLWTRRRSVEDEERSESTFGDWPGDVEIIQSKEAEEGSPECEDSQGQKVDIKPGTGACECRYANFDID